MDKFNEACKSLIWRLNTEAFNLSELSTLEDDLYQLSEAVKSKVVLTRLAEGSRFDIPYESRK